MQVPPLTLAVWASLEHLLSSSNQFVATLALVWVLLITSALRFAHFQRSSFLSVEAYYISGRASKGKRRVGGKQRPFEWRASRFAMSRFDLGKALDEFARRLSTRN